MNESEAGSKEEPLSPSCRTPSSGWHSPQDWPPAEAPLSSRLTGILRSPSDWCHRTFDRVFPVVAAAPRERAHLAGAALLATLSPREDRGLDARSSSPACCAHSEPPPRSRSMFPMDLIAR